MKSARTIATEATTLSEAYAKLKLQAATLRTATERMMIERALEEHGYLKQAAAASLGITPRAMTKLMQKHKIVWFRRRRSMAERAEARKVSRIINSW